MDELIYAEDCEECFDKDILLCECGFNAEEKTLYDIDFGDADLIEEAFAMARDNEIHARRWAW